LNDYVVEYRPEVNNDLDRIPKNIQLRIKHAIEKRLATIPHRYGERLRRSLLGLWKLRVGDYRVVYEIKKERVEVWIISHRKDVYEKMQKRWLKS
jgi:mRNA interferase RelE/StbE